MFGKITRSGEGVEPKRIIFWGKEGILVEMSQISYSEKSF